MTKYHHGDLREALLDAAEELVRERGADGWSLREASARVGVSPSAAYHHFASRDALVRALSGRVLARLGERLAHACENASDPREGLVALGRAYVRWAVEDPAVARLAFGTRPEWSSDAVHPHDVLIAGLDRLVESGGLPAKAREGADFVYWPAVHGLAVLLADGLVHLDDAGRQTERVVHTVLNGLTYDTTGDWPTPSSAHTDRTG
ncbi:AcrR family transcriptional regulator [Amycolatopsis bartoniae]|uniref:HTH tetR-type domain-containing protein n=1 Tax=Amycolatopsis bartoniae TaxID=941986 RepID=A0A8H9ME34_9PSEU|nr:TetR/AcrR family transcriptional regulator [Amycolatopsis bartoniae]MBB2936484.1 AcrR family transcriptional regulator [Amycolatopsis bartoniae]TVT11033.1 TetR/AcrR family transcriptional regulator [Amycolatopsis bartoniae]GHF68611.1 hypothetical protein GCM10017566_48060 [Amycolatopsis bartoniae]